MPTAVHDCHQVWLSNELLDMVVAGFLTIAERKELNLRVGTTFTGFATPYASATQEPDACILPDTLPIPTVVVETGWSESWPRLDADKDLWLVGGASVELVLLIRWTKLNGGRVKGDLHVHGKDPAGNVVLLQTEPLGEQRSVPATAERVVTPFSACGKYRGERVPRVKQADQWNFQVIEEVVRFVVAPGAVRGQCLKEAWRKKLWRVEGRKRLQNWPVLAASSPADRKEKKKNTKQFQLQQGALGPVYAELVNKVSSGKSVFTTTVISEDSA
ncbi:hypothetical protein VTO42DRAFT_8882 [Malbranchea cinnamomea]